jgi:phage baseplate assembly protein V
MSDPVADSVATMLRRVLLQSIDTTGPQHLATFTGLTGELFYNVPRHKEFGFSSSPPAGSTGLLTALGGRSDRAMVHGLDHPAYGPRDLPSGATAIYDASGNAISLVQSNIRVVSPGTVTITAPTIVLDGDVHLGGTGGVPAAMQGTVDTGGNADVSNLATKVFVT